ncbi:fuconate dehydratase, partial [Burkholderia gladioli]
HLSMIDYVCIAGTREGRVIEYVDHLHEHFVEPCVVRDAAYMPPSAPGFSIEMKPESLERYRFRGETARSGESVDPAAAVAHAAA